MSELLTCRTCARTRPKHNLLPLFDRPQLHEKYSRSLLSATGLQIKINDGLPQHICNTCSDSIKNVLRFKKSCEMANKVLIEATSKRKTLQTPVIIEKTADKFESKHSDYGRRNTKSAIKVVKGEREMKSNACNVTSQEIKCNKDSSLIKFVISENNDASSKITTDLESLTNYIDVESTAMFDDVESFNNDDYHKSSESSDVSGKVKILSVIDATTEARENSKKQCKSSHSSSNSKQMLTHDLEKPAPVYTCLECNKNYSSKSSLVLHTKIHTDSFMCEECNKTFRSKTHLSQHQRGVHGKTDIKLKCPHCEYYAAKMVNLKIHIRRHTGERPYICDKCGASFTSRMSLRQHLSFHITEKTVQCEQCPSMFTSRFRLKHHRYISHGPKRWRYQCRRCPKAFNALVTYRNHMAYFHSILVKVQEKPV